jgi:general stress protein 26
LEEDRQSGDLETVCARIRDVKVTLLTITDSAGSFHTRPFRTLQADGDGPLWFFADWSSPKVEELEQDARVNLGYPGMTS